MSINPGSAKTALRRQFREKLRSLSAEERATASSQLRRRLVEQPVWQSARSILFYVATAAEPDLGPLINEALAQGRIVALPRYAPAGDRYEAGRIQQVPRDLAPGQFGILEPTPACPSFDAKRLDLALVPGIGFSFSGGRLGRGQGFYDRLLAEVTGFKCGVAFECQMAPDLPLEPHDVRLNCILTPESWHLVVGQVRS